MLERSFSVTVKRISVRSFRVEAITQEDAEEKALQHLLEETDIDPSDTLEFCTKDISDE